MTRAEAVKILKGIAEEAGAYPSAVSYVASDEDVEALNMAIAALKQLSLPKIIIRQGEQEPCEYKRTDKHTGTHACDCISRQDAIEAVASRDETNGTVKVFTGRQVNEILAGLPSKTDGDLISRKDAIEALDQDVMGGLNYRRILRLLPSTDRPKGQWVDDDEQQILMKKFIEKGENWKVCNICGAGMRVGAKYDTDEQYHDFFHNFCPNCGSYNGGEKYEV